MDKILSDKMGHDMEALVWETAEELDKKLAERMRRIRRRRKVSQQKTFGYERSKLRFY